MQHTMLDPVATPSLGLDKARAGKDLDLTTLNLNVPQMDSASRPQDWKDTTQGEGTKHIHAIPNFGIAQQTCH